MSMIYDNKETKAIKSLCNNASSIALNEIHKKDENQSFENIRFGH